MEFHRLAVEEKNPIAIFAVWNHSFMEFLNLDVFVWEHLLRSEEPPLPPKSPQRRCTLRILSPSESGPIKNWDYRISEGLVAGPAASTSSTPVSESGSD